jgi:hypothetical protein
MKSPLKMKLFLLCMFVFLAHVIVFAQPPQDPSGDPDVPITGIEILIGAGALIGARKLSSLRGKRKL